MPPQTFFDVAVIHLLTTSTIDRLRELYPEGRFEVRRFRPNIVVESASEEKDFIENSWVDMKLAIGDEIVLKVIGPCTRCVMTTLPQGDLPRDVEVFCAQSQSTIKCMPESMHQCMRVEQFVAGTYYN